ncbi:hypothetical protein GCM10009819_12830 [Agromyces tropicus]|uniref:Uncharacterized protein n=1 Tax=Agromyces tropicus TaxID=555371 RepID=A0ABP5FNY5_9MICO
MNIPSPAIPHAIAAPYTPVWLANRAGSWKTPAPTIEPTTMAVSAGRLSFELALVSAVDAMRVPSPVRSTPVRIVRGAAAPPAPCLAQAP